MNTDNFIKALLVERVWKEDHQNSINGLKCAAFLIRNRVNAGWGGWLQMIQRWEDYAGNVSGPFPNYPNGNDPLFRAILTGIDAIYDGSEVDKITQAENPITKKMTIALYMADLNKPLTPFFKERILADKENHKMCGQCGTLFLFT